MRYSGREFSKEEIEWIRTFINENPEETRASLSRVVCREFNWLKPDGGLKDMSCRVAMLKMHREGVIELPDPIRGNGNRTPFNRRTPEAEPAFPIKKGVGRFENLHLEIVEQQKCSYLWNEYIDRYHYLGYTPLPGAQIRYFVVGDHQVIALLGFGAAAWKTAPRDNFIGWTHQQRKKNLHLIVNNARFLILPWVNSRNLASKVLAMAAGRLADDWEHKYNYRPVLLETFVELQRFNGTCYKAANWQCVGKTKGRGKLDRYNEANLPVKTIWVYPLSNDFKTILCS